MENNDRHCGSVMVILVATATAAAIVLLLLPSSVTNAQQQAEQTTTAEPSPEVNGHFYMSVIFNLDQDSNSFKASNGGTIYLPFEKKNLTGFEIVPRSELLTFGENSIIWSADIKIPIDQTRTMVKDLFLSVDVSSIERRPEVNGTPPSDFYAYSGYGTLSIGEGKWKVLAKFEPEYQTALLRVLSI